MLFRLSGTLLLSILLTCAGCSTTVTVDTPERVIKSKPPEEWVQTQLILSIVRPDGSQVSDAQWQSFADYCAAQFPAGVTILPAIAQYRETRGGLVTPRHDPSRIVIINHPKSDPLTEVQLKGLCRWYLNFCNDQASVLRLDTPVQATVTESQLLAPASNPAAAGH